VTAIRRPGVWLKSGRVVTDTAWDPLLIPTPNHQDYLSTHATFGAAAGAVIRAWNKGDKIDVYLSSNVTFDNTGVITRRITSIKQAVIDNGDSRVFGGVSYLYLSSHPDPNNWKFPVNARLRPDRNFLLFLILIVIQVHFQFASDEGNRIGDWVGRETLSKFDKNWDKF